MIYKNIGQRIQKAREEAGLSQEELATKLGLTQAALSNYELGKRRLYLANIEQIARELNKPLNYFLEDTVETIKTNEKKAQDETILEISKLLSELPLEERKNILEYIQWRKEKLK
ncbi:MAG: helix-turn-helix transcriptional regulator [Smithellaceae bacterium]|jgi:transcriptional regulator with XRE-family HTH domain|nr:helix-turn-helix transcriptional regulator [Syntrophaceae bacterium]MDX9816533.1 helix-turn-helix transcriptional regulator [Smithellaceae bacterium]NMD06212.1 helix-turn-helix transcriptional regulator [Deltaproteobacteria bacterium]HQB28629.1 helix-turn-helix transcriptional regulator [Paludibacter sp.]HRT79231.1 helix-turn-helix transcriptional regulator [Paludibacteraceae bacterium]